MDFRVVVVDRRVCGGLVINGGDEFVMKRKTMREKRFFGSEVGVTSSKKRNKVSFLYFCFPFFFFLTDSE